MAVRRPLTLHQNNDETLILTITPADPSDDLTVVTELQLFIKIDMCYADDDDTTLMLSSTVGTQIAIISIAADEIRAEAFIPASALAAAYDRWWRVDALAPGGRRTAMYGPVTIVDL